VKRPHPAVFIAIVSALVAFSIAALDVYIPSMPAMALDLATDAPMVLLTMGGFLAAYAPAQLIAGPLSDRFGRRKVLVGGTAVYIAASIACAYAATIEALIALRLVQAVGACVGPIVGRAMVRDLHELAEAARVLSYVGMALMVAPILAPIVGAWIEVNLGWRWNFGFMAAFAGVALVAALAFLPETNPNPDRTALQPARMVGNYRIILGDVRFVGYALAIAFAFGGVFSFITASAFILIDLLGFGPQEFSFLFGLCTVGYLAGSFCSTRLTPRRGLDRTILYGTFIYGAASALLAAFAVAGLFNVFVICGPMIGLTFGAGLVVPNAQAGAMAPFPRMAGAAVAMTGFLMMAGAAATGLIVGWLYDGTQMPMVYGILACGAGAVASFYGLVWRRPGNPAALDGQAGDGQAGGGE
jgi:DHA1 family bicyclomycin/chloramphenicol resistance-like MFS transporter